MVLRLGGSSRDACRKIYGQSFFYEIWDTVWNVPEKGSQVYRRLADPAGEICFS